MRLILTQPTLTTTSNEANLDAIHGLLGASPLDLQPQDLIVLPEHWFVKDASDGRDYLGMVKDLARRSGCHVIGGSRHEPRGTGTVNSGVVVDSHGNLVVTYEKLRPYALERQRVVPGSKLGAFQLGPLRCAILICADFWFSDLFERFEVRPDLLLIPSLSVTRKPTREYSRNLWRHLAISRAYEFGLYVGISDWAHTSKLGQFCTAGVGGFADPTQVSPERFFEATPSPGLSVCTVDLDRLDTFRRDRIERGFFWRTQPGGKRSR